MAYLARALALLGGGGAVVGAAGVLLPHPSGANELGMLLVQASSISFAVWLWLSAGHVPRWTLNFMPLIGTVSVSAVVYFSGDSTSAYTLFYLWVAIYAFYLMSRAEAAAQIGFAIANYAVVVLFIPGVDPAAEHGEVAQFAILTGTFLATAVPLFYLRGRVEGLWAKLSDAAHTDLLTGLPNTRGMHEALTTELERARLSKGPVCVLDVDLDRFRAVNEEFGTGFGDEVLVEIGQMIREAARRIDVVARAGPSEFVVVLPEAGEREGHLQAENVLALMRAVRGELTLTASVGIAAYPAHAATVEKLLKHAHRALAAAKKLGRDRAVVASPEVGQILAGTVNGRTDGAAHLMTMLSLVQTLDQRIGSAAERSAQVGRYAASTARELELNEYRQERVRLAGVLHDVGKVGVADDILRKPGPLDESEWSEMRKHPEVAARILGTRELADLRKWILRRHERPDGGGYPHGSVGDQIPLEAKIIAVAAAYVAMRSDRPFRPGMSDRSTRRELRVNAGAQFDAHVVNAFLSALDRERTPDARAALARGL